MFDNNGTKIYSVYTMCNFLGTLMKENGANKAQVMDFVVEFCNDNGIKIPDSFFNTFELNEIDEIKMFIEDNLKKSGRGVQCKTVYARYKEWCKKNDYMIIKKHRFMAIIRQLKDVRDAYSVNGILCRNVIVGVELKNEV